jgi:hypothetical protein
MRPQGTRVGASGRQPLPTTYGEGNRLKTSRVRYSSSVLDSHSLLTSMAGKDRRQHCLCGFGYLEERIPQGHSRGLRALRRGMFDYSFTYAAASVKESLYSYRLQRIHG